MRFRRTSTVTTGLLLAILFGFVLARQARAQPTTQDGRARARELFKQSETSYREGHFQEVVDLLMEAYRLDPQPVDLYNIARAYEGLGDAAHAADAYKRYLESDPKVRDRPAIEERIRTLEQQEHERSALEAQRDAALKEQQQREVKQQQDDENRVHRSNRVQWIGAGAGVAAVGVGVALGITARHRHQQALDNPDAIPATKLQEKAERLQLGANITMLAGGAVAVGAVIWAVVRIRQRPATSKVQPGVGLIVGPTTIGVRGDF